MPRLSPEERFRSKVEVLDTGCHRWLGSLTPAGYGNFTISAGHPTSAHRYAFWLATGTWSTRAQPLDHLCKNRWCVNPEHLEQVTASINVKRTNPSSYRRPDQSKCAAGLHPWVEENLVMTSGGITCRECKIAAQRAAYHQRKARVA